MLSTQSIKSTCGRKVGDMSRVKKTGHSTPAMDMPKPLHTDVHRLLENPLQSRPPTNYRTNEGKEGLVLPEWP